MSRVLRLPQAVDDIAAIWEYIALENSSLAAAERLLDRMDETLRLLGANPEMGASYDRLSPGLRGFSVGKYMLFYQPIDDGIKLFRVLHSSRNFDDLFRYE